MLSVIMLLLLAKAVFSAAISGTIYDYSLEKAKDVKVEVNTEPKQVYISKNSSYAFNVPTGKYSIEAKQYIGSLLKAFASENISIKDDGSYVLDLVLFPIINESEISETIEIEPFFQSMQDYIKLIFALSGIIFVISLILYFRNKPLKNKKHELEDNDLKQVVNVIEKEGGRATQKHIRKEIPLSEAKISLMIAELEHKGIIEKIKKGRGNILVLKKK